MFVTFIIILRWYFSQIMDYRDTRAYILDPCIQEFLYVEITTKKKICFWKRVIWIRLHLLFLYHFLWCSFKNCDKSVVCSSDKMQCILDFVGKRIKNSKYGNRANTGFWIVLSVFCSRVMERNLSVHHTCIFNFFLYVVLRE